MTRRSDRVRSSRSGTAAREGDSPSAVTDKQARAQAREEERARVKRSRRKAALIALAVVVVVVGSAALVYFTPLLSVRTIAVAGASSVSEQEILDRLDVPVGLPLVRVDTAGAAQRVATIPALATVRVQRQYPSTVQVTVEERVPVAFFDSPDGTHLLDSAGVDFAIAPPPPGVVRLVTDNPVFGDPVTKDALAVLDTLPPLLRDQAAELRASTLSDISILLLDGRTVVWGSKDDSERKGAVAIALLSQPGQIFDVSSPDLPTTK
ncbi:cell division protein FtsQ [Rhodococcus sp. 05-2254-6]|uniref:cell division protein FtsQ/DivIB n=1 Tax=Rhodococcus sp. 05-2254-6 TaxID=2022489 RepID=UPI000B9B57F1|nr:FtsQ-type POTRA domain-containing protein [Rhodococcus sp. 05-2254-6]OZE31001.1 cell division protein FtsQ [Rhodococcus sp. 05-2254-6]